MEFYRQKEIEFYKYLNEQHNLKIENMTCPYCNQELIKDQEHKCKDVELTVNEVNDFIEQSRLILNELKGDNNITNYFKIL